MTPLIHFRKSTPLVATVLLLGWFAMRSTPNAFGVNPTPDGCYPDFSTAEGCDALHLLTTGVGNTAFGWRSLFSNVTGSFNTGVGGGTLALNTAGLNTAVGTEALMLNVTGRDNVAYGAAALTFNNSGTSNCAVGTFALFNNDNSGNGNANDNTAVGDSALTSNNDGADNTAVGFNALGNNQADGLTAVGSGALASNDSASRNTAVGFAALIFNDITRHGMANANTAVGDSALSTNTDAGENTAVGAGALQNNDSAVHGFANDNTAVGASALLNNSDGDSNTANGARALMANLTGRRNTAVGFVALENSTDDFNTAVGAGALFQNTTGFRNTALGDAALENVTTGRDNIAIGVDAGSSLTSSEIENIDIDNSGVTGESSTIRIGTVQIAAFIAGVSGVTVTGAPVVVNAQGQLGVAPSAQRFKIAIKPMDHASEVLFALNPVTFRYKKDVDPAGSSQFGLVAEDVAKVNPDLVVRDKNGEIYTVRYDQVNAMLLNEFLKEHRHVQEQDAIIARQQKQIDALTVGLQKISAQLELGKTGSRTVLNDP